MDTIPVSTRWLTVLFLLLPALPVGAAEPAGRGPLLELNNVTGTDVIEAKIGELVQAGDTTRELVKRAWTLAAEDNQPFEYNALHILARAAHELNEFEAAEKFYRLGAEQALKLQSGQEAAQMLGGLIDLYYENRKYDETVAACRELLGAEGNESIERLKPFVIERMLEALARQDKLDEALKLVDKLVKEEGKDGWFFLRIKGALLQQAERSEEAANAYESVLERLGKNEALPEEAKRDFVRQLRYALSGTYTELGQVDKAVEQLQSLLKEYPDDPDYNNDLGYLWADHDRNLDEAEKLIRTALKAARKRGKASTASHAAERERIADFLDSLGWVLFKQTRYNEAKKYLLRAVRDSAKPEVEILDHLGDVHLALGEKDDARKVYQQAIEAAGPSARDQRRKEQVAEKLQMLGD